MSENKVNLLVGFIVNILVLIGLMYVLTSEPFPTTSTVHNQMIPIEHGAGIGIVMSEFLWDFRGLDLLFQTLVLFTTAICCLALLREEIFRR